MRSFLQYLQKVALVFWLGEMLFFVIIFAPRVFKILPRPQAAILQAEIFPAYYFAGLLAAIVLLVTQILIQAQSSSGLFRRTERLTQSRSEFRSFFPLLIITVCGVVFAVCLLWMTPKITALQAGLYAEVVDPNIRSQFDLLHKLSTALNGGVLLLLLILLGILF
jgi:uncharacterized membrane protein